MTPWKSKAFRPGRRLFLLLFGTCALAPSPSNAQTPFAPIKPLPFAEAQEKPVARPAFNTGFVIIDEQPKPAVYQVEFDKEGSIQRTAAQAGRGKDGDEVDIVISVDLPGPERLFRRESERDVFERLRQDEKKRPGAGRVIFPTYQPLSKEPYAPRHFAPMVETVEPSYVCHTRLFFEQPNFERYGWDLGVLTPALCLGKFYYDFAFFPYHFWSRPFECVDSSSGKCLPGDPTPLYLYREPLSVTGALGQAGTIIGLGFVFP